MSCSCCFCGKSIWKFKWLSGKWLSKWKYKSYLYYLSMSTRMFAQTFKESIRTHIRTLIPCFFKWRMVGACPPVSFTQKHLNRIGMFTIILKTWTMLWSGSRTVVLFQTPQHDMTTFAYVHVKQVPKYKKNLSLVGKHLNRFNDSLFTLDTFHRRTDA